MEKTLAMAKKVAEEAEVYLVSTEETPVVFEANRLKHIQTRQSNHVALRIIKQGKVGYATATDLNHRQRLVHDAVETAQFGTTARFELPTVGSYPPIEVFDSSVPAVPLDNMIKLGEALITAVKTHTPDILCRVELSKAVASVRIINSRGGQASYRKSVFGAGIMGTLIHGSDMLFVGESDASCHPLLESKAIADSVIWQLESARVQASIPTRQLPVVFTPRGVVDALVPSLMAGFNGRTVLEGASPVARKLGQKVFDDKLSLRDDPTLPYCPESRPCDDEGVASQRTPLIEHGVVANFFYDLQTAGMAKTQSTGNGGRSRGGLPSPSPSAFVIDPGDMTFDEIVKDMKEGLIIEQLMGAEQGNILGGDFSGNVLLGYKVESGKIVGRVKDTMVSGNIYQALKQITALGSEPRWVGGSIYAPHIYCPSLSVASK